MSTSAQSAQRPGLWLVTKTALFTLVAPACVGTVVPRAIARRAADAPVSGAWAAVALIPLSVGAAVYLWCAWDFMAMGRGTPAPIDAPVRLVVRGLYRYVRNPMYVGVLAMVVGWALWYRSTAVALYAAGLALVFHAFVRLYEEPALRQRFGQEYGAYCRQVHRWLPSRPVPMRV